MSTLTERPFYTPHRDDDFVDEIRIVIRERYKTSGLSGDEWRFHRVIQLFRKGALMHEDAYNGDFASVASYLPWKLVEWREQGGSVEIFRREDLCFQPGCQEKAVSEYEIIEQFGPQGQRLHPDENGFFSKRRRFCVRHLRRGDCDREDCDANYRVISGPGPDETDWTGAQIRESARVDLALNSFDELPAAINDLSASPRQGEDERP